MCRRFTGRCGRVRLTSPRLVLRTNGDPLKFVSTVRAQIAAIDPNLPMYNIKSMDKLITEAIVGIAYIAVMMTVLGVIALALACVGIFGVMSYSVSERTHEIGIRMSQGAQTKDILALVLNGGMRMTLLGWRSGCRFRMPWRRRWRDCCST